MGNIEYKFTAFKINFVCIIFRLEREAEVADSFSSRILIITGSDNECDKYVRFMNIIFTAQKQVRFDEVNEFFKSYIAMILDV